MKTMSERVQELLELRRMKDEIDDMISAVQGEITAEMEIDGVDEVTSEGVRITWKPVTSSRFDKAAYIRANGEDAYKSYCKSYSTRRFTVSA